MHMNAVQQKHLRYSYSAAQGTAIAQQGTAIAQQCAIAPLLALLLLLRVLLVLMHTNANMNSGKASTTTVAERAHSFCFYS
jgi:hypothetical protein